MYRRPPHPDLRRREKASARKKRMSAWRNYRSWVRSNRSSRVLSEGVAHGGPLPVPRCSESGKAFALINCLSRFGLLLFVPHHPALPWKRTPDIPFLEGTPARSRSVALRSNAGSLAGFPLKTFACKTRTFSSAPRSLLVSPSPVLFRFSLHFAPGRKLFIHRKSRRALRPVSMPKTTRPLR